MIHDLKPYPVYKDSGVPWLGQVPEHWEVKRLKSCLSSIESGAREQSEAGPADGIPSLGGEHIGTEGQLLLKNMRYVTLPFFENLRKGVIKKDDVLLVKDGATIGKTALVYKMPYSKCAVNEHVFIMRTLSNCLSAFLYHNIRSRGVQESIWQEVTGSAQPGLNSSFVKFVSLAIPPLPEQSAIVRYLDHMDRRIRHYIHAKQKLIKLLEEQKQAIIHHAVTRGLDPNVKLKPSGVEWLGDVPEHWELIQLTRVLSSIEQGWSPVASEGEVKEDQWAVLTLSSVKKGIFYPRENKPLELSLEVPSNLEVKKGDFLLTRSNTRNLVGDVCVVEETRGKLILCDLIYRLRLDTTKLHPYFLMYQLLSSFGRGQIEGDARGSSSTMVKISHGHIKRWNVVLPPLDEQMAIVNYLKNKSFEIEFAIIQCKKEINLIREYRTRLISDVVTGKLDVREAAASLPDEVEEPVVLEDESAEDGDNVENELEDVSGEEEA